MCPTSPLRPWTLLPLLAFALSLVSVPAPDAAARDGGRNPTTDTRVRDEMALHYYPLRVGNKWHNRVGDNTFCTLVVKRFEKVGGQTCARLEMLDPKGQTLATEHIVVKPDGVYRVAFEGNVAEPPVKFLQLPAHAGERWEVGSAIGGEKLAGEFRSGRQPVGLGNKVYDCATAAGTVDANGTQVEFTYYFARGVGMIRQEVHIAGQKIVLNLERFEPAQ
jgi:hypothetical protein